MNIKILTFLVIGIITLGGTTGIVAANNAADADAAATTQSQTAETTAAATETTALPTETTAAATETTALPTETTAAATETTAVPVETTAPLVIVDTDPTTAPTAAPTTAPTTAPVETVPVVTPVDPAAVKIDEESAKTIALDYLGTNAVVTIELKDLNGVAVYEIAVKTTFAEIEIVVDANTGVVLSSAITKITDTNAPDDLDGCKNDSRKNDEAKSDNEARKNCDADWDGQTRKNDEAKKDNEARMNDVSCDKNIQD